tara:strand:+ start:3268 stop:4812 length:1545 start_codon:yes stop_codon:yes gene_type:complete
MSYDVRRHWLVDCKFSTIDITKHDHFYVKQKHDARRYFDNKNMNMCLPWVFSKCFAHDQLTGYPYEHDVDKLTKAIDETTLENINKIQLAPDCVSSLVYPFSGHSFNLIGMDSSSFDVKTNDAIDGIKISLEMSELYVMSLMRNRAFSDIILSDMPYAADFNNYKEHHGLVSIWELKFRGSRKDETEGPYISQFLYHPILTGGMHIEQKFKVDEETEINNEVWLQTQNGHEHESQHQFKYQYIHSPQVLASAVHYDTPYQFYYNACLIALQNRVELHGQWTSGGVPSVLAAVAHVSVGVLRVAWYLKWGMLRIRPEEYAHRINLKDNDVIKYTPGLVKMIANIHENSPNILADIRNKNGSLLMNSSYREGAPNHPSFPSGHACIAAACVTVMKAMFVLHDTDMNPIKWSSQTLHSMNGDVLVDFTGDGSNMTIIGELNKLVSNVSLGRQWAGVHYMSDSECGIEIGEKYAERYLMDIAAEYFEKSNGMFSGWILERFDGEIVKINHMEIQPYQK